MSSYSSDQRDRALRRLRTANRIVIGGAVVLTGLLTDVAANAFPGHTATHSTVPGATSAPTTAGAAGTTGSSSTRRHHHALSQPAQAPSTSSAPAPSSSAAPQSSAPSQPVAPAPQPVAPSPVVSGGS